MEFNKSYPMPKSWLDPKDKDYDSSEGLDEMLKKEESKSSDYSIVEEEEKRIDIIGQNGNDGLHYDEQYDLNKDGKIDEEEAKYMKAVEKLKSEKENKGLDSTWFLEKLSKIPKPPSKNNN